MNTTLFHFEHDGKKVLGFDTGLDERSFARAKAGSLVIETGYLVSADAQVNIWKAENVAEINNRMIIWGPDFDGTPLDVIIQNDEDKNAALNAIRYFLKAAQVLFEKNISLNSIPRGVIVSQNGAVLFPPSALVKRCLEAEGAESILNSLTQYVHPDLEGIDALLFSSSTMLYRIFSGVAAFPDSDPDDVRSNMRNGNFIPLHLASPSLDEKIVSLINNVLGRKNTGINISDFISLLGMKDEKRYDDFFKLINDDEKKSLAQKEEQYRKRNENRTKMKKLLRKKQAAIICAGIGFAVLVIIAWNVIAALTKDPLTKGMTPFEIVEQYYDSFGTLDHMFMDDATIGKAGNDDMAVVQNLFVITKVRQAYEMISPVVPAQEWIDAGSPETESVIFGVSFLELSEIKSSADEVQFEAKFDLWVPPNFIGSDEYDQSAEAGEYPVSDAPVSISYDNIITLSKRKDVWYISEIVKQRE